MSKIKDTISLGDWVIVKHETDKSLIYNVNDESLLRIANFHCKTYDLIGHTYGSQFSPVVTGEEPKIEADGTSENKRGKKRKRRGGNAPILAATLKLVPTVDISPHSSYLERKREQLTKELEEVETKLKNGDNQGDNRNLQDDHKNQTMGEEEIETMRGKGVSSDKIVEALKQNSKTFHQKSDHAQDKYLMNKQKKHSLTIRVLRCNAQTVGDVLWHRTPLPGTLLGGLRYKDVLPKLLAYGNVHSGARVLVCDTINGYLLGSVMERLGGKGEAIATYIGPTFPNFSFKNYFNLSDEEKKTLKKCDLTLLLGDLEGDEHLKVIDAAEERRRKCLAAITDEEKKVVEQEKFADWVERKKKDKIHYANQRKNLKMLREEGADSLVMICKWEPQITLLKMLPYLGAGRRFVLYSEYIEPLVRTRELLEEKKMAIGVRVVDTWLRKYQVLPGRTHPMMRMNGRGGFLLYGTKVENNLRKE